MKSHHLLLALQAFLEKELATALFPDPNPEITETAPRVYLHNLPDDPERATYPFVILRLGKFENDEDTAVDTVLMALGVWSDEGAASVGLIAATLSDIIRAALLRQRIIADTFELELPLIGVSPDPDRQWNQYHMATLTTSWNYHTPRRPHTSPEQSAQGD